jgi:hypothetical protein
MINPISLAIPLFNEEKTISILINQIKIITIFISNLKKNLF